MGSGHMGNGHMGNGHMGTLFFKIVLHGGVAISAGTAAPNHNCIGILISALVACVWYEEGMARSHPDAPRAPLLRSRARSGLS